LITPSWWIPDSWANALAPTTALFGWIANPVRWLTSRLAVVMCSVWTRLSSWGNCVGRVRRAINDLLQGGIPGALAEPVDRDLHLARAGLDRGERVRRRQAQVVVAVDGDRGVAADEVDDPADERGELGRDGISDRVGDVDRGGPASTTAS